MNALRKYLTGIASQEDVARELGISTRQLQRLEEETIAWWMLGLARELRKAIGAGPCRISENVPQDELVTPRAVAISPTDSRPSVQLRAGLPRRFGRKP